MVIQFSTLFFFLWIVLLSFCKCTEDLDEQNMRNNLIASFKAPRLKDFKISGGEELCQGTDHAEQASFFFASIGDLAEQPELDMPSLLILFDICDRSDLRPSRLECLKSRFWFLNPDTITYARTFLSMVPGMAAEGWTDLRALVQTVQLKFYPFLSATYEAIRAQKNVTNGGLVALCRFQQLLNDADSADMPKEKALFFHNAIYFLFSSNVRFNRELINILKTLLPSAPCPKMFLKTLVLIAQIQPTGCEELICALTILQRKPEPCAYRDRTPLTVFDHCKVTFHSPTLSKICDNPELARKLQGVQRQSKEIRQGKMLKFQTNPNEYESTELSPECICQLALNVTKIQPLPPREPRHPRTEAEFEEAFENLVEELGDDLRKEVDSEEAIID